MKGESGERKGDADEKIDLQAFQARLEASLGNIQALVQSWIPQGLQQTPRHTSTSTFVPLSSTIRNSRLGLGSSKEKETESTIKTDRLQQQISKKHKKRDISSCTNEGSALKLKQSEGGPDEDEDSRTSTFNRRHNVSSSLLHQQSHQQPPSKVQKRSSSDPTLKKPTTTNVPQSSMTVPSTSDNHAIPPSNHDKITSSVPNLPLQPSSNLNLIAHHSGSLSKRQIKKLRKLERAKFNLLHPNHNHNLSNNHNHQQNSFLLNQTQTTIAPILHNS